MDDINFKDIRVLPSSLDIKSNVTKSPIEILSQLQSGSIIKALVVEADVKDKVIFDTPYGKFSVPNKHGLVVGDSVSFKLSNLQTGLGGNIVSINDKKINLDEPLKLEFIRPAQIPQKPSNIQQAENHIAFKDLGNMPRTISGTVSYLNLDNIDKSSALFKAINHASGQGNQKLPITANLVFSNRPSTAAFTFSGIVSDNGKGEEQLIKTDFGIITTQGTKMPIGQKLVLEMVSLNNQPVSNELTKTITDFVFNLSNSALSIKNLTAILAPFAKPEKRTIDMLETNLSEGLEHDTSIINHRQPTGLKKQSTKQHGGITARSLDSIVALLDDEEVKKLAAEYQNIKELLTPFVKEETNNFKWHSIFIPFYNGQKLTEREVKIDRSRAHYLRFVFNVDFDTNSLQIDGLIHFENDDKTPRTFDMTLRSKNTLDAELVKKIAGIYNLNQTMTGVRGALSIENFDRFVET